MFIDILKSKIHLATVTHSELHYEGSLTIDENLMNLSNILPHEKVQVVNVNNGARFETYAIKGEKNSGTIGLNGPAARLGQVGDKIIIITYARMTPEEANVFVPKIIFLDGRNKVK